MLSECKHVSLSGTIVLIARNGNSSDTLQGIKRLLQVKTSEIGQNDRLSAVRYKA